MEESMISTNYMSEVVCSSDGRSYSSDEESSWTFYLDDFKTYPCGSEDGDGGENDYSLLISGCGTSSTASEAVCSAFNKQRFDNDDDREGPTRRTCAKRRKTRAVFVDHDLEDTASSPDHTPKAPVSMIFNCVS